MISRTDLRRIGVHAWRRRPLDCEEWRAVVLHGGGAVDDDECYVMLVVSFLSFCLSEVIKYISS